MILQPEEDAFPEETDLAPSFQKRKHFNYLMKKQIQLKEQKAKTEL